MQGNALEVRIDSRLPFFVSAAVADIAAVIAHASADEQAEILRQTLALIWAPEMRMQRDYIGIELAKPEHDETRERLAYLISPEFREPQP